MAVEQIYLQDPKVLPTIRSISQLPGFIQEIISTNPFNQLNWRADKDRINCPHQLTVILKPQTLYIVDRSLRSRGLNLLIVQERWPLDLVYLWHDQMNIASDSLVDSIRYGLGKVDASILDEPVEGFDKLWLRFKNGPTWRAYEDEPYTPEEFAVRTRDQAKVVQVWGDKTEEQLWKKLIELKLSLLGPDLERISSPQLLISEPA